MCPRFTYIFYISFFKFVLIHSILNFPKEIYKFFILINIKLEIKTKTNIKKSKDTFQNLRTLLVNKNLIKNKNK